MIYPQNPPIPWQAPSCLDMMTPCDCCFWSIFVTVVSASHCFQVMLGRMGCFMVVKGTYGHTNVIFPSNLGKDFMGWLSRMSGL